MKVVICGMAGSGKNTVAKSIAEEFELKFYCGGDILKEIAEEEGYKPTENWWDTEEGMEFVEKRSGNHKFDREVDKRLKEKLGRGNVVITSRTMPWLYEGESFNIWLKASRKERSMRISKRDNISVEKASQKVDERDKKNKKLYKNLYGIELQKDFEPFDMIVDTEELSIEDMNSQIILFLKEYKATK